MATYVLMEHWHIAQWIKNAMQLVHLKRASGYMDVAHHHQPLVPMGSRVYVVIHVTFFFVVPACNKKKTVALCNFCGKSCKPLLALPQKKITRLDNFFCTHLPQIKLQELSIFWYMPLPQKKVTQPCCKEIKYQFY